MKVWRDTIERDLVDGNCPIHGRPVEHMKEDNYFFKLSRYGDRLLEWYAAHPDAANQHIAKVEALLNSQITTR